MSNRELYLKTLEAINDLFSDTSVSRNMAQGNLEQLRDEIDLMLRALREDEKRKELNIKIEVLESEIAALEG